MITSSVFVLTHMWFSQDKDCSSGRTVKMVVHDSSCSFTLSRDEEHTHIYADLNRSFQSDSVYSNFNVM